MNRLFTFLLICHIASPEPHSLWYILSATSGISDFPECLACAVVDGVEVAYCDNNLKVAKPRTPWMSKLLEDDPQHMQWLNDKCLTNRLDFKATIITLKQRFNQSEGVHIFQRTNGCFWDVESGEFDSFNKYGCDGEDLIGFDLKTLTWITPRHQTVINKHNNHTFSSAVFELWEKFLEDNNSSLSVSRRLPPLWSPATLQVSTLKEPRCSGGKIPSVPSDGWRRYDCVFQVSGLNDSITTRLDRAMIRTNQVLGFSLGKYLCIAIGVGLLLLSVLICVLVIGTRRRNRNGL